MPYITPNFTREELACPCCGKMEFSEQGVWKFESLRVACGFPIIVASGYRCPTYDAKVHRDRDPAFTEELRFGPHTIAENNNATIDVKVFGHNAHTFLEAALSHGATGIGIHQRGPVGGRFIHCDFCQAAPHRPRPWPWTY